MVVCFACLYVREFNGGYPEISNHRIINVVCKHDLLDVQNKIQSQLHCHDLAHNRAVFVKNIYWL